jgi:5-methylcytosine-specific restriction endonuclease McrA
MRLHYNCPTGPTYTYTNDEEFANCKLASGLNVAHQNQRISDDKVKISMATLASAVGRAEGLMKQNTEAFAQTDRILAEAVAQHAKNTAYFKAEKEKYERDAADEQGALKRILAAAEQEKADADDAVTAARAALVAHNTEKEERATAALRKQREREAAAAEAAARRARELREHEDAVAAAAAAAAAAAYELQLTTKATMRKMLTTKASTPPVARPATRSTARAIITEQTKQTLLIHQGGLCGKPSTGHGCGRQLPISRADGESRPIFDIDHILPLSDMSWCYRGDPNNIDNLQALCPNCHAVKSRHTDRGRVVE